MRRSRPLRDRGQLVRLPAKGEDPPPDDLGRRAARLVRGETLACLVGLGLSIGSSVSRALESMLTQSLSAQGRMLLVDASESLLLRLSGGRPAR